MTQIRPYPWIAALIGSVFATLFAASGFLLLLSYAWATQPLGWESMSLHDYYVMFGPITATTILAYASWTSWKKGLVDQTLVFTGLAVLMALLFALFEI